MSDDSHQAFLKREMRKSAVREMNRSGRTQLPREEIQSLKIQTVEPWKRILLAGINALVGAAGVWLLLDQRWIFAIILIAIAITGMVVSIRGKRESVEAALGWIDLFSCGL